MKPSGCFAFDREIPAIPIKAISVGKDSSRQEDSDQKDKREEGNQSFIHWM
jgi:hypothetical protein